MVDPESGCVVTFNGEIYNFRELRRELEQQGERFRSSSDTEVLLKAYKRWGLECVANLDKLPAKGATIVVGSPKHSGGTGGPSRVFAMV